MPDLDLRQLPPELQAALERVWPGCPEAQRRALLGPGQLGHAPHWPRHLWAWQPARRWWRPWAAREARQGSEAFFAAHLSDARGEPDTGGPAYPHRLFDPAQPFFPTPWTQADVLLRSPVPDAFGDAEFWFITQRLCGGRVDWAVSQAEDWAQGLRADGALRGARRLGWLADAQWRLHMAATGMFT